MTAPTAAEATRAAILRGDHDALVLDRARALGWSPPIEADLERAAEASRAAVESILSEVSSFGELPPSESSTRKESGEREP